MKRTKKPPADDFQIRCPKLGHQIYFSYCRGENKGIPCFKTLDCWFTHFLVEDLLREELSPEEWKQAFEVRPKIKMVSILEMVDQAKKRQNAKS